MEFDKDGRIIVPGSVIADKEEEKRGIIIKRVQLNLNNPAVAQLKIVFPSEILKLARIESFYEDLNRRFPSVTNSMFELDQETIIVEARESKLMYTFLELIEKEIENLFDKEFRVFKRGDFPKFQEDINRRGQVKK